MSQRFYNISLEEMDEFLKPQGFQPILIDGVVEVVYAKVVNHEGHRLSLRVYTAIWPSGESRERGSDAIRVQTWFMEDGKPQMVGRSLDVKRITTWAKNLGGALERWKEDFRNCPGCGAPMCLKNGQHGEFWGCVTWRRTKCDGKTARPKQAQPVKPPVPVTPVKPPDKGDLWTRLMATEQDRQSIAQLEGKTPAPKPAPPAAPVKPLVAVKPLVPLRPVRIEVPKTESPKKPQTSGEQWEFPGDPLNVFRIAPSMISKWQLEAEKTFRDTDMNMMLPARAGGGKTVMLKHLATFRKEGLRFTYQAFGSKNAAKARKSFPRGTWCMTTHSHLLGVLRETIKGMPEKADDKKNWYVMEEVYPSMNDKTRKRIRRACFEMIGLAKNYACRVGDLDAMKAVMDKYAFPLESDREYDTVIEVVNEVLSLSRPGAKFGNIYDCDDMLWWWVILDLAPNFYHVALLDEVQDFNWCQLEMVRRMLDRNMRIVAVGDPFQALFRFRGADKDAYKKLEEILDTSKKGCKSILLPINYRCAKSHIRFVVENTVVKDIEAAPDAIEGRVITDMGYDQIIEMIAEEHQPMMA